MDALYLFLAALVANDSGKSNNPNKEMSPQLTRLRAQSSANLEKICGLMGDMSDDDVKYWQEEILKHLMNCCIYLSKFLFYNQTTLLVPYHWYRNCTIFPQAMIICGKL